MSRGVNPRPSVATRHAEAKELDRVRYCQTGGAWDGFPNLGRAASRVLAWFAALHRSGEYGFVGTRAPAVAVAAAIERATKIPLAERTYWRAIAELSDAGLVERSTWGGGRPTEGPGGWFRRPISVVTLTPKAIDIWSKRRSGAVSAHCTTNTHHCQNGRVIDHGDSQTPLSGGHGKSLRTYAQESKPIPAPAESSAVSPVATCTGSARLAVSVPAGAIDGGSRRQAGKVGPQFSRQSGVAVSTGVPTNRKPSANLGRLAPVLTVPPASSRRKTRTWRSAADGWLAVLELLLAQGKNPRAGRAAVERARDEMEPWHIPTPDDSGIDWPHWVWLWPDLSRQERWALARRELAPRLLGHELATRKLAAVKKPGSVAGELVGNFSPVTPGPSQAPRKPDDAPYQTLSERLAVDTEFAEALRRLGVNLVPGAPARRDE